MRQALRATQMKDIASHSGTLRERIKAGMAVDKLNKAIAGTEELSVTQFNCIRLAIDKCLPSLQAIMVHMNVEKADSMPDLIAQAQEAGIDPSQLIDMPEKKVIEHDVVPDPPTPEIDE